MVTDQTRRRAKKRKNKTLLMFLKNKNAFSWYGLNFGQKKAAFMLYELTKSHSKTFE